MSRTRSSRQARTEDETTDGSFSLGNTVDVFETRLHRKRKEQELKEDASQRETEARHARMLQAMTTIRKALQETCKIRLGDRFQFMIDVTDWEGWPRVELCLVDSLAPERKDYGLIVSANDRQGKGNIVMTECSGRVLGKAKLCNPEEFNRLPFMLKKTVREFLDIVAEYVLNPIKAEDLLEQQTQAIEEDNFDMVDDSLGEEDLFTDDSESESGNVIRVGDDETEAFDPIPLAMK